MTILSFDDRLEAAICIAEKYSGFSSFHASYRPLFKRLWREVDPKETGALHSVAQCEQFANGMVAAGWKDWAPSARERALWADILKAHGEISLEHFAEASENQNFKVGAPTVAAVAAASGPKAVIDDGNYDDEKNSDGDGERPVFHGARSKAEAGRRMVAGHAERMQNFQLPPESQTKKASDQNNAFCEGMCFDMSMCQMPYCGLCKFCNDERVTSNQAMCEGCALDMGRCCACGFKLTGIPPHKGPRRPPHRAQDFE